MLLYKLYTGGRCMLCQGCNASDCGDCGNCKDKKKYGGPGKKKKCCIRKICTGNKVK